MSKNAVRLVKKLSELGYTVNGSRPYILRDYYQPILNKRAGEFAPCWKLLVNPLVHTGTNRVVSHGSNPVVEMPDGVKVKVRICSHMSLTHILRTPICEWEVYIDEYGRLWIETKELPSTWL